MALVSSRREEENQEFVGDASLAGNLKVKRGFGGSDSGAIRNTPFTSGGNSNVKVDRGGRSSSRNASGSTPFTSGGSEGIRIDRGSGFGRAGTGGRVRSRQPRRPSAPQAERRRAIASPERQRQAGRNLVSQPDKVKGPFNPFGAEPRDFAGDANALLQAPIGGLTEGAVTQQAGKFKQVTDPVSGFTVPDQADKKTKAAFRRFFDTSLEHSIRTGGSQIPSQRDRNADPTRAAFQNTFFPSETLSDLGIGKQKTFRTG